MNLNHYNLLKNKRFPFGVILLAISGMFLLSGVSLSYSNYGKYQRSRQVAVMFEKGNLPPDHAYYYAHTVSRPGALIGIDPAYTLDNHLWTRVDPAELKHLMDNMSVRSGYSPFFYGSYMVSPDGKTIGIYYSRYDGGPIAMGADNKVNVNLPNIQDDEPEERGSIFRKMDD